jgi:cyclopropane fatty-acyl-phospholipid synthase-like methyltransferase
MKKPEEEYDRSYFSGHAKNYMSGPSLFWKNRIKNILELISPIEGDDILDLGTVIGSVCIEASKYGASCIGVDLSEDSPTHFIEIAKLRGLFIKKMNHA